MADKIIFLSHIHEESPLALKFQNALELEFGGFVDVFVSSDGKSIPAGSNFLKRIEDALLSCTGALYLISPASFNRPWISFELGAVWVRNAQAAKSGANEVPALPVCHSGMSLSALPAPLNNLNGIAANEASQLKNAFSALQQAVGGKGRLRTDFGELAHQAEESELCYMVGSKIREVILL